MQALLALLVLASPVCAKDPTQGPNGGQAPKVDKPLSIDEAVDRYSEIISGVQPSSLWSGDISALLDAINKVKSEHQTVEGIETAIPAIRLFLQQNGKIPPPQPPPGAKPGAPQPPHAGETAARELAGRFPGDPQLRITGGAYAFERKDYETALRDYEHAVAIDPANRTAMLGYGVSAYELGDYALALKAAKQMLARDRRDADALGLYHFANGRAPTVSLPSAIFRDDGGAPAPAMAAAAPAAYSAAPAAGYAAAAPSAGFVGSGGAASPPAAPSPADAAAAEQAQRSAVVAKEASIALRLRNYPTAHQLASQAITIYPENVQALYYRAVASTHLRRYADAVNDASAALSLAPNNPASLQARSWAFAKQGRYREALVDADASLAQAPNMAAFYQSKAFALAGLNDRAGALDALRRSAQLDPRYAALYERAAILPNDQDLTLLFSDDAAAAAAAAAAAPARLPPPTGKRFARLALLSATGGLLVALAILNIVSAGWREKVRATIRRALSGPGEAAEAASAAQAPLPSAPGGSFWTQYEVVREIGVGGMGVVYEALDRSLERRVAVKKMRDEIRADPREKTRFVTEARTVAQLRHPNIVDIYGIVEDGQEVFLVFEFVEGRTLHDRIRADGPLGVEESSRVLRACVEAVEHAHSRQIVHRDLKPSNVMLLPDGRVKVMDFGVARQAKDALTKMSMTNTVVGTPPYMAPEQEQGTVRRESDVFALGVCLYEMLTGQLPFSGSGAAMLLNKINGKHVPASQRVQGLPPALDAVLARALHPDPDKRYRTPTELAAAFDAAVRVA